MWGNGEARRIERKGCGKSVVGIRRPDRSSSTRYLARRMPRIDLVRIAISPTRKLSAATRKKERTADRRKSDPAATDAGGRTGNRRETTTAIGSVKRTARNADWPAASNTITV